MIADLLAAIVDVVNSAIGSPWIYLLVFLIALADAFLIVVPSETVVVALGAVALSTGQPSAVWIIGAAAIGAWLGDSVTYWVARRVDITRFRWARSGRTAAALEVAFGALRTRAVSVLLTARFIPFGRIVVNLAAGSSRLAYPRFLLLTAISSLAWAAFNVLIGAVFGQLLGGNTVLAVITSVVCAVLLGVVIDVITQRVSRRGSERRSRSEPRTPPTVVAEPSDHGRPRSMTPARDAR